MTPASPASGLLPVADDDWADERTRVDQMAVVYLEVQGATDRAPSRRFVSGDACAPLTVGRTGQFRIDGRGVLDVHAFVHFDGTCVFVCSTDATSPVMVGDHALPRRWTPVAPGTKLRFGDVVVAVLARTESAGAVGATDVCSPPVERTAEPNVVPSVVVDDDATRIDPMRDAADDATRIQPSPVMLVPEPTGVAHVPVVHAPTVILPARAEKQRKRRRLLLVGSCAVAATWTVMALVIFAIHHRKGGAPASAAASSSVEPRPSPPSPQPDPFGESPVPTGVVVHAAPARSVVTRSAAKQPPTTERLAVDALHAGDVARALTLYLQLASEQPDNPAFARAATMLRARTAAGGTP